MGLKSPTIHLPVVNATCGCGASALGVLSEPLFTPGEARGGTSMSILVCGLSKCLNEKFDPFSKGHSE